MSYSYSRHRALQPARQLTGRATKPALEPVTAGKARCHLCHRAVSIAPSGRLRQHKDRGKVECPGGGRPPVT
jgi:hypothetical protein